MQTQTAQADHRGNLAWLADNFRFMLLLDEVGRKIEPAYQLKDRFLLGETSGSQVRDEAHAARQAFASAPIEDLFRTYARRVRSRGELGELSSLNQKVWLEYRELDRFLAAHEKE